MIAGQSLVHLGPRLPQVVIEKERRSQTRIKDVLRWIADEQLELVPDVY